MKRLVFLVLFAFAVWYGWKHYPQLLHPQPRHEAVVRNHTGLKITRLRLNVGGHTYVKEELPANEDVHFPFVVDSESPIVLDWEYESNTSVGHWTGGSVSKGPLVARHVLTIDDGGGVVLESEPLGVSAAGKQTP
jgi:hypothetical protein